MKISKSKRQLAQLLIEAGVTQFPDGANWAAQSRNSTVTYFNEGPWRCHDYWEASQFEAVGCLKMSGKSLPNWHQTVLSRAEFDQVVAETAQDADGWIEWKGGECPVKRGTLVDVKYTNGKTNIGVSALTHKSNGDHVCGTESSMVAVNWGAGLPHSGIIAYRLHKPEQQLGGLCDEVTEENKHEHVDAKPTLDQFLRDWRNADDYAKRKQTEADEAAAMRDERWKAVQACASEMGVTVGRCDSVVESDVGWVEWHGGEQPVGDDTLVLIRLRDGYDRNPPLVAHKFRWTHRGDGSDIIAYQLYHP